MSKTKPDLRRMLLRLPHSRQDYAAIMVISELAGLLGADLVGTYVEDLAVQELASFPNAREFRAGSWQPVSARQLARDAALAAQDAERLFFKSAAGHRSNPLFRIAKTSALSQEALADDIIAMIDPKNPIERATHQFNQFVRSAFSSASSILLMPSRPPDASGPIIVFATDPNDPSVDTALDVAGPTGARIILIAPEMSNEIRKKAQDKGLGLSVGKAVFRDEEILLPAAIRGRLLIMNRRYVPDRPRSLQIPTLLVSTNSQTV
ncbi:hypothetical protein [Bradyrhizobium sp.]|uniref:hypothetical protein n=1 Tax=Bradyrhizobium sp. TaxID=376 RepID=UPI00238F478C|nr:hypothetical protein [Bradyrhizobium sp.]MDE1935640.1 hypothetical protein [Bradyrhizobium sp.]